MEIKSLSDQNLVSKLKNLVKEEQNLTLEILKYLREIERRRLFSDFKCSSLREFAMKELGYSSDEAESRITAMRIIKDVPVVEEKVKTGELSLTHLKLAQNFFNTEKRKGDGEYSKSEKLEFLETLCDTSTREAQKIIFQESTAPQELVPDKIKEISNENIEFRFVGSVKLRNLIDESKGLLAHKFPGASLSDIMEMALEKLVGDLKPAKRKQASETKQASKTFVARRVHRDELENQAKQEKQQKQEKQEYQMSQENHEINSTASVPKAVACQVRAKAQNLCENCGSIYALQIEHIKPRALGGTHELSNLKLLCRSCNQRQA